MFLAAIAAREGVLEVRAGSAVRCRRDGRGSLGVTLAEAAHVPMQCFIMRSIADGAGALGPAVVSGVTPSPTLVAKGNTRLDQRGVLCSLLPSGGAVMLLRLPLGVTRAHLRPLPSLHQGPACAVSLHYRGVCLVPGRESLCLCVRFQ